jgi:hypothetical protein
MPYRAIQYNTIHTLLEAYEVHDAGLRDPQVLGLGDLDQLQGEGVYVDRQPNPS